jgi:hypothetical protein
MFCIERHVNEMYSFLFRFWIENDFKGFFEVSDAFYGAVRTGNKIIRIRLYFK